MLFATNHEWWDHYWGREDGPRSHHCEKWTNSQGAATKYGLNFIDSRNKRGLSQKPDRIHHGHSSGFCLLNLAYLMGAERIVLLGYDMRYASDYGGKPEYVGSTPRHYFGEYPSPLQHWPKVQVKQGVHIELVSFYEAVAKQELVEIINCTPGSAVTCFQMKDIDAL